MCIKKYSKITVTQTQILGYHRRDSAKGFEVIQQIVYYMNIISLMYTLCVDLRGFGFSPLLLFVVSVPAVAHITKRVCNLNV